VSAQSSKPAAEPLWTIRTEKGALFGPAAHETLRGWARDGRIAPTSEASQNGTDWVPVTTLGLDMDWIAEIAPATFYGPIHRHALDELIREGSLKASAGIFRREQADAPAPALQQADLLAAVAARRDALARAEASDQRAATLQSALNQAQSDLKARDHEFDAERQELKAAQNRLQAEGIKKEGRIAALEAEIARLQGAATDGHALQTRAEALEAALAQARREADEAKRQTGLVRQSLLHAEQECAAARAQADHARREQAADAGRFQAQTARIENARRLSQQLAASLAAGDPPATEDACIVTEPDAPPPPISPPTGKKTAASLSLADLEVQAQRELRKIGETNGGIFKGQKKHHTPNTSRP
jgi:DNA repair exonuclease SbcCD ATPase subunit